MSDHQERGIIAAGRKVFLALAVIGGIAVVLAFNGWMFQEELTTLKERWNLLFGSK